mgnify:CR=1 FL=1
MTEILATSAKSSIREFFAWIAFISINLGVMNLLPLPALDGCRIFFMLIELIRKKPVPAEKEGIVHMIGLMLLLGFAVVVFFNDIFKLIG